MSLVTTTDPTELARRRARRGAKWLSEHAPYDWQRRFVDLQRDGASCRLHFGIDCETPLALAFEQDAGFSDRMTGYVTDTTLIRHFQFTTRRLYALGFSASPDFNHFGSGTLQEKRILENAWWYIICTDARPSHLVRRHSNAIDRITVRQLEPRWWAENLSFVFKSSMMLVQNAVNAGAELLRRSIFIFPSKKYVKCYASQGEYLQRRQGFVL